MATSDAPTISWVCPICGPSLVLLDGDLTPFCVRHGSQTDIDADPDLEEWHRAPGKTSTTAA